MLPRAHVTAATAAAAASSSSSVKAMMQKAVTTASTFYSEPHAVQGYKDRKDAIRSARRAQKDTLSQWYGMRKATLDDDARQELELLQYRNFLDPERQHQAPKRAGAADASTSQFVEFGFVAGTGRNKRRRYKSFADEWVEQHPQFLDTVKQRIKRNVKLNKKAKAIAAKRAAADAARATRRRTSKRKPRGADALL